MDVAMTGNPNRVMAFNDKRYRYGSNEHEGERTYSLETIKYTDRE